MWLYEMNEKDNIMERFAVTPCNNNNTDNKETFILRMYPANKVLKAHEKKRTKTNQQKEEGTSGKQKK